MTPASFFNRHKRALALMLAAILLHVLFLDWAGGRLAAPEDKMSQEQVVVAHLQPPPPPLDQLPAPSAPQMLKSQTPPPVKPRIEPRIEPKRPPAATPAPAVAQAMSDADAIVADAPPVSAPAAISDVPPAPAVIPDASPTPALAQAAPAAPKRASYKVDVPPSAQMAMQVVRKQPNANPSYGVGRITWTADTGHYSLRVEAGLDLLFATLNLIDIRSEGALGSAGIEPASTVESRRGRSQTATHFNRGETPTISFSASSKSSPLAPGAQDTATLMMQLAGIGRADASQLKDNQPFEIQVGEAREATLFAFFGVGFENIETKLGTLRAWHVTRPPRPGTYSSRLDFWFAPALGWYPVQIRNTEANGAVTTQTVTTILTATASSKNNP